MGHGMSLVLVDKLLVLELLSRALWACVGLWLGWLLVGVCFCKPNRCRFFVSWDITRSTSLLVYGLYRMDILLHFGWVFTSYVCWFDMLLQIWR